LEDTAFVDGLGRQPKMTQRRGLSGLRDDFQEVDERAAERHDAGKIGKGWILAAEIVEGHAAAGAPFGGTEFLEDEAGRLALGADFSDDFLEDVFDSDETGGCAEFVEEKGIRWPRRDRRVDRGGARER
jgi:hypothetical protein